MLNAKQQRFAREYAVDHVATQAAIRAGYSRKTAESIGSRLLKNVKVRAEVESLEKATAQRLCIEAEAVLQGILRTTERAGQAGNYSAALRGYELLGKHLGLFTVKMEVAGVEGDPLPPTFHVHFVDAKDGRPVEDDGKGE